MEGTSRRTCAPSSIWRFPACEAAPDLILALWNVLRAVPIERLDIDHRDTLHACTVAGKLHGKRQLGVGAAEIVEAQVSKQFEAPLRGVVHYDDRHPVVPGSIPGADILAVAGEIGETQAHRRDHLKESPRTAPVLHVRPACLAHRGDEEAVGLRQELGLELAEPL